MLKPLLGFEIPFLPIYQIMIVIGFFAALIKLNGAMKFQNFSKFMKKKVRKSFFFGSLFGLAGANVANWFLFGNFGSHSLYELVTQGGFTFYFGMLTFFLTSALILRMYKIKVIHCLNLVVPSVLLAQFFGRIGCSLRGCCYGMDIHIGDLAIPFPAREIEALFVLIMCIILSKRFFAKRFKIYMFSYSIFRFFTEFFRGDERGSFLGIPFFSPTQVVSFIVIFISGIALFTQPFLTLIKQEDLGEKLKNLYSSAVSKVNNIFTKKGSPEYSPRPFTYTAKPKKAVRVLKALLSVFLAIVIVLTGTIYFNPLNVTAFDNLRYDINDAFSFIYQSGGKETPVGDTNGVSMLDVSVLGSVKDSKQAANIISSYDTFAGTKFKYSSLNTLANGSKLYVFDQTVQNLPVFGKTRVLLTDINGNALYLVGDAAEYSYSTEILKSYQTGGTNISTILGSNVKIIEKKDYWYDTGRGLVAVYHAILSKDGKTPVMGAVVEKSNNQIICFTPAEKGIYTPERNGIQLAGKQVYDLYDAGDVEKLKAISKRGYESGSDEIAAKVEKAIIKFIETSELDEELLKDIIESTEQMAEALPSVNVTLYREMFMANTRITLENSGALSERQIEKAVGKAEKAFNFAKLKPVEDEVATAVTAEERNTVFRHKMDYDHDVDLFTITAEENHSVAINVKTAAPVVAEVYDVAGRSIIAMYVESNETIVVYPEDGSIFTLKIVDQKLSIEQQKSPEKYSIGIKATDETEEIPDIINRTLSRMTDAYSRSNLASFASMYSVEGRKLSLGESLGLGGAALIGDSCASCVGLEDGLDTAKAIMAEALIIPQHNDGDFNMLRGSSLDLNYVTHKMGDNGEIFVKAKMVIRMDDFELYNGYTFFKMEVVTAEAEEAIPGADEIMTEEEKETLDNAVDLISQITSIFNSESYYITHSNTPDILAVFGDTVDNISATSDMESLYEYITYKATNLSGEYIYTAEIDEKALAGSGHSDQKISGFKKFILRHNLATVKSRKASLEYEYEIYHTFEVVGEGIYNIYSAITDPVGYIVGEIAESHEVLDKIWTVASLITDPAGVVTDEIMDGLFDFAGSEADRIAIKLAVLENVVDKYETRLNALETN